MYTLPEYKKYKENIKNIIQQWYNDPNSFYKIEEEKRNFIKNYISNIIQGWHKNPKIFYNAEEKERDLIRKVVQLWNEKMDDVKHILIEATNPTPTEMSSSSVNKETICSNYKLSESMTDDRGGGGGDGGATLVNIGFAIIFILWIILIGKLITDKLLQSRRHSTKMKGRKIITDVMD